MTSSVGFKKEGLSFRPMGLFLMIKRHAQKRQDELVGLSFFPSITPPTGKNFDISNEIFKIRTGPIY